ncbi:MAG: ABC transporter ATP-binding protein [Thermoplasmata archaeon]|jgi:putative ABC transport system ATP-binding protein
MIAPSSPPSIELVGVWKRYSRLSVPIDALRDVRLTLRPGEHISVEGPSGCGKTTLMNLLGLLDTPTAGEVLWDGRPVGGRSERERAHLRLTGIGFIFQRFYLLPTMTARENVELPLRAAGVGRSERIRRAEELLEEVGLQTRSGSFPHQLSGGEEQRVAIARALANRPVLLLADEPTGELDSAATESVLALIETVGAAAGATVVTVTHNPEVAARSHRHITMRDGRVIGDRREE